MANFYSKRTQAYMNKRSKVNNIKSVLVSTGLMMIPVLLISLIILDWLRVFRLSWLF